MDMTGDVVKLRAFDVEDADPMAEILANPDVARFAGSVMLFPQPADRVREWVTAFRPDTYRWALESLEDRVLLGDASLNRIDFRNRNCWFGIVIGPPDRWGRGYGTEATILVTRFAFRQLGLEKVYLGVFEGNDRAKRVYEKAGYRTEAELPRHHFLEGRLVTSYVMAAYRDHPLYAM
jgi:RimJ/RimL family protein N-acetyltransferase